MSAGGPYEAKFAATHAHFQFRSDYRVNPGAQPQPGYTDMLRNYFAVPLLIHRVWANLSATTFVVPDGQLEILVMDAGHINTKAVLATTLFNPTLPVDPPTAGYPWQALPVEWYAPPGYGMMVGSGDLVTILFPNWDSDTIMSYGIYYSYK